MNYNSRVVEQTYTLSENLWCFSDVTIKFHWSKSHIQISIVIILILMTFRFPLQRQKSLISIDSWVLFPLTIFFNSIVGKDKPKIVLKANIFRIPLTYYKHNNPLDYFFMNGLVVDPPACWYCCCVNGLEGCAVAPVDPLA